MGLPTPLRQSRINAHPYIRITNEAPMQSRSHPANVVHALFKMVSNNRLRAGEAEAKINVIRLG